MSETLAGWTVTNAIPPDVITGLMAGQYRQYGGVIRWAPDTGRAGQIVRHLLPAGPRIPTVARDSLQIGNPILAANGTMALAGLSLSVGVIGFAAIMYGKLTHLNRQLSAAAKDLKEIKKLLQLTVKTELEAALRILVLARETDRPEDRMAKLNGIHPTLLKSKMTYRALLADATVRADTLAAAFASEQYFFIASLASAACLAEQGRVNAANQELKEDRDFWVSEVCRIAKEGILRDDPERFMFDSYVEALPTAQLTRFFDFVEGTNRGYRWVDELRKKLSRRAGLKPLFRRADVKLDTQERIPALQRIVARDEVLQGYVAQYDLLGASGLTPSEFGTRVARIDSKVDGYVVLAPPAAA